MGEFNRGKKIQYFRQLVLRGYLRPLKGTYCMKNDRYAEEDDVSILLFKFFKQYVQARWYGSDGTV